MRRSWSHDDEAKLIAMYASCDMREICEALGRTAEALRTKASKLGLKRENSPNIKQRGRQHSKFMQAKRRDGYRNTTRVQVGEVRLQGGRPMCKVADTGSAHLDWKPAVRAAWEAAFGEIPEGFVVICKDGDRGNTRLDNLELITKAEKLARHSITNYPIPYQRAKQDLGRFLAKLKRLEKANEEPE